MDVIVQKCQPSHHRAVMWRPPVYQTVQASPFGLFMRALMIPEQRNRLHVYSLQSANSTVQAQKFQRCLIKIQSLYMTKCDLDAVKRAT